MTAAESRDCASHVIDSLSNEKARYPHKMADGSLYFLGWPVTSNLRKQKYKRIKVKTARHEMVRFYKHGKNNSSRRSLIFIEYGRLKGELFS